MDTVLKKNIKFRIRCIANRNILFGKGVCVELNELAYYIHNAIDGVKTIREIVDDIAKEYDVERSVVESDVTSFIDEMKSKEIFIEVI